MVSYRRSIGNLNVRQTSQQPGQGRQQRLWNNNINRNPMSFLFLIVLIFVIDYDVSYASLLDSPNVRWMYQLNGSGGLVGRSLRKNNAIVTHDNGNLLFVTTDDGSLHILDANELSKNSNSDFMDDNNNDEETTDNDSVSIMYEPDVVSDDKFVTCQSSVTIIPGGKEYVLYAVIDTPIESSITLSGDGIIEGQTGKEPTSRLLAINFDGTLRWTMTMEGIIVGTPLVSYDGTKIYISHNVLSSSANEDGDDEEAPDQQQQKQRKGQISIALIDTNNDTNPPTITATLNPNNGPFGPPTISTINNNNEQETDNNNNDNIDLVVVAESWGDGYSDENGNIYAIIPSEDYNEFNGQGNDSYQLITATSSWPYSSITRPTLGTNGQSMWVGGSGSNIAGWTGNRNLQIIIEGKGEELEPKWSTTLQPSERNESQPLLSAPVITSDESLVYYAGASYDLFCLEADSGREVWTYNDGRSVQLVEPKLFENDDIDSVLYTIESVHGNVRQHDAMSGRSNWEFSCFELTGIESCQNSVEAEFSLSPSGNVLYYGDVFGRIVALNIATFETEAPTLAPTAAPSEPVPTATPVQDPTPSPSIVGQSSNGDSDNNTGSIPSMDANDNNDGSSDVTTDNGGEDFSFDFNANQGDDDTSNKSLAKATMSVGILAACLVICGICVFIMFRRRSNSKGDDVQKGEDNSDDEDEEDDIPSPPDIEGGEYTNNEESNMSIEVIGGNSNVYTPNKRWKKKKGMKNHQSSSTPTTLESIEEDPETPSPSDAAVVLLGDETYQRQSSSSNPEELIRNRTRPTCNRSGGDEVRNLEARDFSFIVEVQTEGESETVHENYKDGAKPTKSFTEMLNATKDLTLEPQQDHSNNKNVQQRSREDSSSSSPSSSSGSSSHDESDFDENSGINSYDDGIEEGEGASVNNESVSEEKKDDEEREQTKFEVSRAQTPTESGPYQPPPNTLSPTYSSGSSLYMEDRPYDGGSLSPLSPHILSKELDEDIDVPDDEARMGRTSKLMMPSIEQQVKKNKPNYYRTEDEIFNGSQELGDLMAAPGAHYMNPSSGRNLSSMASDNASPPPSPRPTRNSPPTTYGKYGKSVRPKVQRPTYTSVESSGRTGGFFGDVDKKPTFKRVSRSREKEIVPKKEDVAKKEETQEDTWSSFLKELADAEKQFFCPDPCPAQQNDVLSGADISAGRNVDTIQPQDNDTVPTMSTEKPSDYYA